MQEQIQEERTVSFEEICPEWSKLLAENGGYMESRKHMYKSESATRNMMDCKNCIVGEAHGLS